MKSVIYIIKQGNKTLVDECGFGDYQEWFKKHLDYDVVKRVDRETSTAIKYYIYVRKVK